MNRYHGWLLILGSLIVWVPLALAFTAPSVVDTCNRTENPLASGWAGIFDPDQTAAMTANGTVCIGAAGVAGTYWGTLMDPDMVITATLSDAVTTAPQNVRLGVRMQQPSAVAQTVDGYRCVFFPGAAPPAVEIRKVTNGDTGTLISSSVPVTINSGDGIGCQILGNTISLWHKPGAGPWTLITSVFDTTWTGPGYVSFDISATTLNIDDIGLGRVRSIRLGLHHTAEEVALWQQRLATDAEYPIILASADAWVASPTARWTGQTTATCWNDTISPPGRATDAGMVDAGLVYVLTGTASYRTPVLAQLLAQAAVVGTDFSDTTRWCVPHDGAQGVGDDFGPWLRRLLYAYSFIRSSVSAGDQALLDSWFSDAATWINQAVHTSVIKRFPNRLLDDYTGCTGGSTTGGFCPGVSFGLTHFGGWDVRSFANAWNNQTTSAMALVGAVGVMLNDPTHIASAKRYVKEWLAYGVAPGGIVMDQHRWNGATPQHGYLYPLASIGSIVSIADHLARTGDLELYTYSTTIGLHGSAGTPAKTILATLQHEAALTNATLFEYASTTSTSDPLLRIDQTGPVQTRVEYVNMTPANLFYRDTAIKTAYTTTIPGSFDNSGCDMLRGEWCDYSRVGFMFGSMEGLHNPFAVGLVLFHVAKTGSDAVSCDAAKLWSTNPTQAKLTIQAGINCATTAGDTVQLHLGTYVASAVTVFPGASGSPIVIQAWPDNLVDVQGNLTISHDWVTLQGFRVDQGTITVQNGANDVQLLGMTVTNAPAAGISLTGTAGALDNILIDGCTITGSAAEGILGGPDNLTVQKSNVTLQGCAITGNGLDGISMSNVNGLTIKDSLISTNGGNGIAIRQLSSNILVEHNTLASNAASGLLITAVDGSSAPPILGGAPFTVTRNTLLTNGVNADDAQIRILSAANVATRSVISNNVLSGSTVAGTNGIGIFRGTEIDIYHNTIANVTQFGVLGRCYHDGVLQNNIIVGPGRAFSAETSGNDCTGYANGLITEDYNLLRTTGPSLMRWTTGTAYATLPLYQAGTGQGAHSKDIDPQFAILP